MVRRFAVVAEIARDENAGQRAGRVFGAVGGGAHAADEHVLVDALAPRTALLAALVDELLGR